MICNTDMEQILSDITIKDINHRTEYPVLMKINQTRQPYWVVDNFCGIDKTPIDASVNLTDLEWDGNEIYLAHTTDLVELVKYGLGIIISWKEQLEREYTQIPFDILLSIDHGDEEVNPSATLRFWAIRKQYHYIEPSFVELQKFEQPVLMEQVNYKL
ncbi:conserved hypothetical protein [[Clostridium] saccharolyticum WM1]|uniref:Uncharacterized protein n=2 Tax=Lacrimispora TaxID=2719231 RepID=D9R7N5_LACSW|nr:conserved hypothetical protein [[Clostridium] saccharolyticum WM1]